MKILWFLFVLHTTLAQPGFGRSYLGNSRLCHQWNCINTKLGLTDFLPPSNAFGNSLRSILPTSWHGVVDEVVNTCYKNRPRQYTNTCPGQALLHCAVDQLVTQCPEENLRNYDACSPVDSVAGHNYMFSQSRYENFEKNSRVDKRPLWYLKRNFDTKCCNLPELINATALAECGIHSVITFFTHNTEQNNKITYSPWREASTFVRQKTTEASDNGDFLRVVSLTEQEDSKPPTPTDPLSCCDMSGFIDPAWRQECGFELALRNQSRLAILDGAVTTDVPTVTTVTHRDLVVLPPSCEKSICVFDKLNITSSGAVDVDAFKKLLDNLTDGHPSWSSAKARVLTTCLTKPLMSYDADCEVNKVLACIFDVLSENCPNATKNDMCKHARDGRVCQISSSKYRPKHRRGTCVVPEIVEKSLLNECGLSSLHRIEQVVSTATKPKKQSMFTYKHKCRDLTASTSCFMNKMGVLNKYGFMDYFKMKDAIRRYATNESSQYLDLYLSMFANVPLYGEHCNSAKKLLNVLDSMLMTCPTSKRSSTPQCIQAFTDLTLKPAASAGTFQTKDLIDRYYALNKKQLTTQKPAYKKYKIIKKPLYNYGVLSSVYVPKVQLINVKPKVVKKPIIMLPVYMRIPYGNMPVGPYRYDGVLRSPFSLHNRIAQAHGVLRNPQIPQEHASTISNYFWTTTNSPKQFSTIKDSTTPFSTATDSSKPISTITDSTKRFPIAYAPISPVGYQKVPHSNLAMKMEV